MSDRHVITESTCLPAANRVTILSRPNQLSINISSVSNIKPIAVLTLEQALNFSDSNFRIRPVCLPPSNFQRSDYSVCRVNKLNEPLICKSERCNTNSDITANFFQNETGRFSLTSLRRNVCITSLETPFINIVAFAERINEIIRGNSTKSAPIFGDIPESPRQSGGFSVSPWFPVNTRQEVDKSLLLNGNNSPKNFRQKTESVRSVTQGHLPIFFAIIDSSVLSMAGFLLTI